MAHHTHKTGKILQGRQGNKSPDKSLGKTTTKSHFPKFNTMLIFHFNRFKIYLDKQLVRRNNQGT